MAPLDPMSLADWRRRVTDDAARAWQTFRESRDTLFREHSQSSLSPAHRDSFDGLSYFPSDSAFRVVGLVERDVACDDDVTLTLADDGLVRLENVAQVRFELLETAALLNLFWIQGYGGGIFLPFRDVTAGNTTLWRPTLSLRHDQRGRSRYPRVRDHVGLQLCLHSVDLLKRSTRLPIPHSRTEPHGRCYNPQAS